MRMLIIIEEKFSLYLLASELKYFYLKLFTTYLKCLVTVVTDVGNCAVSSAVIVTGVQQCHIAAGVMPSDNGHWMWQVGSDGHCCPTMVLQV